MINSTLLYTEIRIKASRSSGKGGQNVNKVASKVTLQFHIASSAVFDEVEKAVLLEKLSYRISKEGLLTVTCEEDRSQLMNKRKAFEKMIALLERCFVVQKPRKATKPSKSAVAKRLTNKAKLSEKKQNRRTDH